jgi:hypothetical protein
MVIDSCELMVCWLTPVGKAEALDFSLMSSGYERYYGARKGGSGDALFYESFYSG